MRYKHDTPSSKIGPDMPLYWKNWILGVCRFQNYALQNIYGIFTKIKLSDNINKQ